MSITISSIKAAYLAKVAEGLSDLSDEDREEVIQDLEAHLAELDDDAVEATLGTPGAFVTEFRNSAGLEGPRGSTRFHSIRRLRDRLAIEGSRLSRNLSWPTIRPLWIWTRGWLVVSVFAGLTQDTPFLRFPIPNIEFRSTVGAILVAAATWLSIWLDDVGRHPVRDLSSVVFSMSGVLAILIGLLSPITLTKPQHFDDSAFYPEQLTAADGHPVDNIYAFDLEGNPVEVLLFDQEGRPLLSLASYVYEDSEFNPGMEEFDYGSGTVTFKRDQFGRAIPNLYPLQLSTYDDYGGLNPMPPPSLGFPAVDDEQLDVDPGEVTTTIVAGR